LLQALFRRYPLSREAEEILGGNAVGTGGNLTRLTALLAGVKPEVPCLTLDMQCASGAAALSLGFAKVRSGLADVVLCGGFESASLQPLRHYAPSDPRYTPDGFQTAQFSPDSNSPRVMLEGAERTAQVYGVTREELDRWPVRSHQKAAAAGSVVAPYIASLFGSTRDESIRPRMSAKLAARMPTLFTQEETEALLTPEERAQCGTVAPTLTAANACLHQDGAAFVLLASERKVRQWQQEGKAPEMLAEVADAAEAGVNPRFSPLGALAVGDKLLQRSGLGPEAIDTFEYNEAFGVISALFARKYPGCLDRYLPLGGALAYGHPYGASGAVLVLHALARLKETGGIWGLCAIAGAGGTGSGLLLRRV
jgi:acetyl-CoA C-acetyltransferase